jgi:hypothetical protein
MRMRTVITGGLLIAVVGCKEQRDDAQQAVSAAKAIMDLAKEGKKAEAAAQAAEKTAREQIAPGTDPAEAEKQVQLAKSLAAMHALGAGGAAVNWRQLAAFVPEKLGDYVAKGELDGSTNKAGGFEVTEVKRRYEAADKRTMRLKIVDATATPFLRAPFAMATMVNEDSTSGYRKGKTLGGYSSVVSWRERSKESSVDMLVAQRFLIELRIEDAKAPEEAERLIVQLKLDDLAKVKADAAPAAAPVAVPAQPAQPPG